MIIDVHSHTPQFRDAVPAENRRLHHTWRPDRSVDSVYSWDDYLEAQKPADKSIVFGVAWAPGEITGGVNGFNEPGNVAIGVNDATAAFANAYPERLIGFMSVHPHDPKALEEIERSRTDLNLRGIKMGANYQVFDPLEARALAIYREAERHGLPILFHIGTSPVRMAPIRYAHPLVVDEIAMRYPKLKIIMAHMGHPWTVDTAVVIRKHPNVYVRLGLPDHHPRRDASRPAHSQRHRRGHQAPARPRRQDRSDHPPGQPRAARPFLTRVPVHYAYREVQEHL